MPIAALVDDRDAPGVRERGCGAAPAGGPGRCRGAVIPSAWVSLAGPLVSAASARGRGVARETDADAGAPSAKPREGLEGADQDTAGAPAGAAMAFRHAWSP